MTLTMFPIEVYVKQVIQHLDRRFTAHKIPSSHWNLPMDRCNLLTYFFLIRLSFKIIESFISRYKVNSGIQLVIFKHFGKRLILGIAILIQNNYIFLSIIILIHSKGARYYHRAVHYLLPAYSQELRSHRSQRP